MSKNTANNKLIRVLVADDHDIIRRSIRKLLAKEEGVEVIAEAKDGPEVLRLVGKLQPDIVLLDIAMPRLNGLEVATRLQRHSIQVLIVSMHARSSLVRHAIKRGARGYVLKSKLSEDLALAIKAVGQGQTYFSLKEDIYSAGTAKTENFSRGLED
ncbi:MAG: response regulator transcription factor [Anaerolineae bacterium]|nr:response regulator transcription factor [Anaerolineae bacterium]